MKLCIVRHGVAVLGADSDDQRVLRPEGLQQAHMAGRWLASEGLSRPQLFASPYVRTQQTATEIGSALGCEPQLMTELVPGSEPQVVVEQLLEMTDDVVLVSHLPLVGRLAAWLVDGEVYDQPWSPAECWLLEGDVFAAGCMTVTQVWYPELENT
ncbi:phosphohistidine phosphatase SixA [Bacterioplanes sanyensis]|uniref:phosphohistidine phosphatase SixA n=1 Tax=Bacterioplanes sanyensis TaxID=1249553 RepID=UPI001676F8C5|nr:phosphohistidine phosphatase SixA [Bacterioplanes sanyensis]GGY40998.1 phosphohistidine phosphatase SixA [Bacterioplanes sanyensis]